MNKESDQITTLQLATQVNGRGVPFIWGHTLLGCMAQEDATGVFGWQELTDIARVIRFDANGHGQSDSSHDPYDHTWERRAEDMWAVTNNLTRSKQVVLGGASMGGATALHAACEQPEKVKGLILVIPPTAWDERNRQVDLYNKMSTCINLLGNWPFKLLQRMASFEMRRITGFKEKLERNTARHMNTNNYKAIIAALRGAALSDLPPVRKLKRLKMPVLILAWPGDKVHPVSTAEKLAELLPNASLSVASHRNAPYQWGDQVREFLLSLR
ncbi:MAG: alpha/beta fold hydrolase [Pseudomonadales bacterium]